MRRLLTALIIAMLSLAPARAAVSLDATGTVKVQNITMTSDTYTGLTVGTAPNRALICYLSTSSNSSGMTLTWDSGGTNQAMTQINTALSTERGYLFGLINPTPGNKTLALSWTTTGFLEVNCASFKGVRQSAGAFYNSATATGNSTSPSVTCNNIAAGDAAVDSMTIEQAITSSTQTNLGNGGGGPVQNSGGSYSLIGGGNVTFGWTTGTGPWSDICAGIQALRSMSSTGAGP